MAEAGIFSQTGLTTRATLKMICNILKAKRAVILVKLNSPYGFGRLIRANGDVYEGMCKNYRANGKGKFRTITGDFFYNGDWLEDKKSGYGEEIY
jgi:hypothetical protein